MGGRYIHFTPECQVERSHRQRIPEEGIKGNIPHTVWIYIRVYPNLSGNVTTYA
jgi:hypothetical protein